MIEEKVIAIYICIHFSTLHTSFNGGDNGFVFLNMDTDPPSNGGHHLEGMKMNINTL